MTTTTTDTAALTAEKFVSIMETTDTDFWELVRSKNLQTSQVMPESRSSDPSYYVEVGGQRVYVGNPEMAVYRRFAYIESPSTEV